MTPRCYGVGRNGFVVSGVEFLNGDGLCAVLVVPAGFGRSLIVINEKNWTYVVQNKKTWAYAEITGSTEAEIRRLMVCAAHAGEHERTAQQFLDWAYGVFLSWNSLTAGWQVKGDSERLMALTDPANGSDGSPAKAKKDPP